jgi:GT2 family glycosyltransferase
MARCIATVSRFVTRVDLIIPTFNGSTVLTACLRSLKRSTFSDFRLIVFDDASTEDIGCIVANEWDDATIMRADQNIGLAAGCNRAILAGSSEYVVLLNNDTEVEPDWLENLVACADRHPNAGSIASKLRLMSDRGRLHSAGDFYSVRGMPGNRGAWLDDYGQYDREEEVFAACGGAALYRRLALMDAMKSAGQVFEERLFMYCEDVDLAWRLQRRGWSCVFAPDAVVYHHLSATGGGTLASYFVARNSLIILARSVPRGVLKPYRLRISAYHLGRLMRALKHAREPAARAQLRGILAGVALAVVWRGKAPIIPDDDVLRLRALLVGA